MSKSSCPVAILIVPLMRWSVTNLSKMSLVLLLSSRNLQETILWQSESPRHFSSLAKSSMALKALL